MTNDEKSIRACFECFGKAVFMAQCVEKGIMNLLIANTQNFTKMRHDELLMEKSKFTFGQLKREILAEKLFEDEILKKIDSFHQKRDWLSHNYWWERAIEFSRESLRVKIITELEELTVEFEALNAIIGEKCTEHLVSTGGNINEVIKEFSKLDETPANLELRVLGKNETLLEIYSLKIDKGLEVPIFLLEDGSYWTLCESGLTLLQGEFDKVSLEPLAKTVGIFPVSQFNPKPKTSGDWNYELNLKKKGLSIEVRPTEVAGKFAYKWTIKN